MSVLDAVRQALKNHFEVEPTEASVTFLGLEPMSILRFATPDGRVHYASLGCSRHPMHDPAAEVIDQNSGPRAEVVLSVDGDVGAGSGVHRSVAILAAAPAVEGVVLATEALIDLGEPLWRESPYTAALLFDAEIPDVSTGSETVHFFQVAPLLGTEAAWVRLKGVGALETAWDEAGIDGRLRQGQV